MSRALNDVLVEMDQDEIAQLYKTVFSTPEGKLVLQDLENRCYFRAPTPMDHGDRPEGMRMVYLHILTWLDYLPQPKIAEDSENG